MTGLYFNYQCVAEKEFALLKHPISAKYIDYEGTKFYFSSEENSESIRKFYDTELTKNGWVFSRIDVRSPGWRLGEEGRYFIYTKNDLGLIYACDLSNHQKQTYYIQISKN